MLKPKNRKIEVLKAILQYSIIPVFLFLYLLSADYADAKDAIGKVTNIEGKVDILRDGRLPAIAAKAGDLLFVKDLIRTKSDSKAEILFADGNIIKIAPRSRIDISEYASEKSAVIRLPAGKVEAVVPPKNAQRIATSPDANKFEVRTITAIGGVRGTQYFVFHDRNVTGILVKQGTVYAYNPKIPKEVVNVTAGTMTTIAQNKPPQPPRPVTQSEMQKHEKDTTPSDKPKEKAEDKPKDAAPALAPAPAPARVQSVIPTAGPVIQRFELPKPPPITDPNRELLSTKFKTNITIKLTWGANPYDLDAHLWVPQYLQNGGGTSHFEVYYNNKGSSGVYPFAYLPSDDTDGYGPETITVYKLLSGNYYYSVKCFGECADTELKNSSAAVEFKDGAGTTYNFNAPTSGDGLWWNVFKFTEETLTTLNNISSSSTALNFMKAINGTTYSLTNGFNAFYRNGSTNIWSDNPSYINLLGYYTPGVKQNDVWYGNVHSYNYKNYTATTYNGGAYYGFLGGVKMPAAEPSYDKVEGRFIALYIDPADSNGISRAGILKGSLAGTAYPYMEIMDIDGTIYRTQMLDNIGITPANLINNISKYSISSNGNTSFMFNGNQMGDAHSRPYSYNAEISGINGLDWGVWNANTTGSYSGITPSDNYSMSMTHNDVTRITGMETSGTQWSSNNITGATTGYWADMNSLINSAPATGIMIGETFGTFDPNDSSFKTVQMGTWVETTKLIAMTATDSGKAALQQMNIPAFEVGRVTLTGSGNGFTDLKMTDTIFLAPSTGARPTIWATGNVSGTYASNPALNSAINVSGGGINADFAFKTWDAANNKWISTINSTGGNNVVNGYNVQFTGAGAGTINQTNKTISGTAAGVVK